MSDNVVLPAFLVGDDNEQDAKGAVRKGAGLAAGMAIAGIGVVAGTKGANALLTAAGQDEVGDLY